MRGAGVHRTASTAAAVAAPTMAGGKLADNTLHGLVSVSCAVDHASPCLLTLCLLYGDILCIMMV
jgi:hypothetical protein